MVINIYDLVMQLPTSNVHFKPGMSKSPLGTVYSGAILIDEPAGKSAKMHQLGWYQLILVLQGKGFYRDTQGRDFALRPGHCLITSPDVPHHCSASPEHTWSRITISFNGALFDTLHQNGAIKCMDQPVLLTPLTRWYRKFYNLLQWKGVTRFGPMGYLGRFLTFLGDIPFEKPKAENDGRPDWLTTALASIEAADPTIPLPVRQIAQKCEIGYFTFRHQFSRFMGYGPSEYHKNLRIKTACELLANGGESFKQIALQLGYCNEFYFSKNFKAKTGLSPRQFKATLVKQSLYRINPERVQKLALQEWFKAEEDKRLLEEKTAAERRRNWRLLHLEDFSAKNIAARWKIQGQWKVANQELRLWGEGALFAKFKPPVPGDVRLEFDCHLESEFVSDVSCF